MSYANLCEACNLLLYAGWPAARQAKEAEEDETHGQDSESSNHHNSNNTEDKEVQKEINRDVVA